MTVLTIVKALTTLVILIGLVAYVLPSAFQLSLKLLDEKASFKSQIMMLSVTFAFVVANMVGFSLILTGLYQHDFTINPIIAGINSYGIAAIIGSVVVGLGVFPLIQLELKWFNQKMHTMKLV